MRRILATIPLIALLPTWCGAKTSRLMSLPLESPDMAAFCEAPRTPGDHVPMSGQSTAAIGVERNVPAVELVEHDPEQLDRFCADH
jgi:hypothetical protein